MTERQKKAIEVLNKLHATTVEQMTLLTDEEYMMLLEIVVDSDRPRIEYYPFYPYVPLDQPQTPYYHTQPYCTSMNTAEKNNFRL